MFVDLYKGHILFYMISGLPRFRVDSKWMDPYKPLGAKGLKSCQFYEFSNAL